jgi:uncharacterized protein YggE
MKTRLFSVVLLGLVIPPRASADNLKDFVEVRGTGEVIVSSDAIVSRLSVTTGSSDLDEAKNRNDRITTQIYELAAAQHLSRPTLMATMLNFDFDPRPEYKGGKGGGKEDDFQQQSALPSLPPGKEYRAKGESSDTEPREPPIHMSRDVEVKFDDLNRAVRFLGEVVKWEATRVTRELRLAPLSFRVANSHDHFLEARRRAVASAKEKATLLAEQSGLKLGNATQIYDESADGDVGRNRAPTLPPAEMPGRFDDPFSLTGGEIRTYASPSIRLVAMREAPPEKLDLNRVPPAQLVITASVRIVFELHKP